MPTTDDWRTNICLAQTSLSLGEMALAFASHIGNITSVYTVNADGSQLIRLLDVGANPEWAPNGTTLAYAYGPRGGLVNIFDQSGPARQLFSSETRSASYMSWSPDGRWISFSGDTGIYLVDAEQMKVKRVWPADPKEAITSGPNWSPDRAKIVFSVALDDRQIFWKLFILDTDTGSSTEMDSDALWDMQPQWSPDGNEIVFVSQMPSEIPQIFKVNADGSGRTQLTNSPDTQKSHPVWSPDGSVVAYISGTLSADATGKMFIVSQGIYLASQNGVQQAAILEGKNDIANIAWAPDGRHIAFTQVEGAANQAGIRPISLYVLDVCTGARWQIAGNVAYDTPLSWRPILLTTILQ
jgi:TolB protein